MSFTEDNHDHPMIKALRISTMYIAISVIAFLGLYAIELLVPENYLPRVPESSKVKDWLLETDQIPPGFILIGQTKITNETIANRYENSKEVVKMLQNWGREESFFRLYMLPNRCVEIGPRSIGINIVFHSTSSGAQQYLDWVKLEDQTEAASISEIAIGDGGYIFTKKQQGLCSKDEQEIYTEIFFRRNHALGSIKISGIESPNQVDLSQIAIQLATLLDQKMVVGTAVKP